MHRSTLVRRAAALLTATALALAVDRVDAALAAVGHAQDDLFDCIQE